MALLTSPSPSYRPQVLPGSPLSPWLVAQASGHHSARRSLAPLHSLARHKSTVSANATREFLGAYARPEQPPPKPSRFDPLRLSAILTDDRSQTPQWRTALKAPTAHTASFRTPAQSGDPIPMPSLFQIKRLAGLPLAAAVAQEPPSTSPISRFDESRFSRRITPSVPPTDVRATSIQIAARSTVSDKDHRRRAGSADMSNPREGTKPLSMRHWAPTSLTPPHFGAPSGPSASVSGRRLPTDPRGIEGDTRSGGAEPSEVHIDAHALGQWITTHLGQALSCPPTSGSFALNHGLALLPGQSLFA